MSLHDTNKHLTGCIFEALQPGVCLRVPCKSGKCDRNMDEAWKTFFLNPGTVCTLVSTSTLLKIGISLTEYL